MEKCLESFAIHYEGATVLQWQQAFDHFRKHGPRMQWTDGDIIIDVGCGDGAVTNVLKKHIPVNYKQLVGCDASEELVAYANDNYGDVKTRFILLDITDEMPEKYKGHFNRVLSCHALSWIHDQRQAFKNIHELLAERGDCLLMFICKSFLFEAYILIAQKGYWKPWVKTGVHLFTRYQHSDDPASEVRELIDDVGFKTVSVNCEEQSSVYKNLDYFLSLEEVTNPYKIPEGPLLTAFMADVKREIIQKNLLPTFDESASVNFIYSRIVIYATK